MQVFLFIKWNIYYIFLFEFFSTIDFLRIGMFCGIFTDLDYSLDLIFKNFFF